MSTDSPYFFMKEFSNEELSKLLINKVKELKEEKKQTQALNVRLQQNVAELEETTAKLEETQRALRIQRDQLAEEVERKTSQLLEKERLAAIGELAARIAHDLRNPLSVAKNSIELLKLKQGHDTYDKTRQQWERLDRALYRLSHQVEDVLDFVKQSPMKKKDSSILEIIENSLDRIQVPDNISIKVPSNDINIPCDPDRMEVVFVNLIMNAIQAMGTKPGKVITKISDFPDDDKFVLIEVNDNGPGIPKNRLSKIFDPLFTTRQIGTGLGLPSCRNIVEKHGGVIDVKSTRGKGASFLIKLPKKTEWENITTENKEAIKSTV